jgi:acyl-CoA synthetase (AMP-forming)/AMP-acid ligase II
VSTSDFGYLPWNAPTDRLDRPCFQDDRVDLTYAQVVAWTEAVAARFRAEGVGPGDVVAIMLPNRAELVISILAAWRLGAAATPINPAFTATEAGHQITDSGAILLVNAGPDAPGGGDGDGDGDGLPTIAVGDLPGYETADPGEPTAPHDTQPTDLALLVYTSGSTGRPKGVMLSHRNLLAQAQLLRGHIELTPEDRCLLVLPLFHCNALLVSVLTPLLSGACTTVMEKFSAQPFLARIAEVRPTYFSGVPAIYALLASLPDDVIPDVSSLRFAICGAAPVSAELLTKIETRFGLHLIEGYGLTESTCCSNCNPLDGPSKLGTVGPPLRGLEVEVIDANGEILPRGERGQVVIRGPIVMEGYLNKPEATAETVIDGWLHTGDVGIIDDDGYLSIVDRIKDMIIRGGENLYPKEIEATIYELDGVLEAAVVGRPDTVMGEVPVAYVALYPGSDLTPEAITEHCRTHLTRVKVPVAVTIVDTIPKNPVGKIDKPALRIASAT